MRTKLQLHRFTFPLWLAVLALVVSTTWASDAERSQPNWSFQRPRRPDVPRVQRTDWVRNAIDAFVLAKLEAAQRQPAPPADKRTLIRRAYFDLIGLPPTPEQVDAFVNDASPDAFEKVIEELLDSQHYGERWGRHWLDVVRYADSAGFETNDYYPHAWRYRDYVIKSLNDDKPYDRFVQEQIAGDELWPNNLDLSGSFAVPLEKLEHLEARVGTGLYTFGPEFGESAMDAEELRYEKLIDAADTTGDAFLGLSFACARCHDHKFDPISQRDYFGIQAVFAASQPVQIPVVTKLSINYQGLFYPQLLEVVERRNAYRLYLEGVKKRLVNAKKSEFSGEAVEAYETAEEKRTVEQQELAKPLEDAIKALTVSVAYDHAWDIKDGLTPQEAKRKQELRDAIAEAVLDIPHFERSHNIENDALCNVPVASVLGRIQPELVPDVYLLDRGNLGSNGEKIAPAVPAVLSDGWDLRDSPSDTSVWSRRKNFALWLTQPSHPLTARVMVNRIWQWHFGEGIVRTPNDFGAQGQPPTHPELLDWLAMEFVDRGWSLKSMHWLIMLSNTYQMSSVCENEKAIEADPENLTLWRMNRRRLEAEAIWDAMHAVAGTLNTKMWGRGVVPPLTKTEREGLKWPWYWAVTADPAEHRRRGVYILRLRTFSFPMFEKFDAPNPTCSCARRGSSTVAPQALWTLNNQTAFQQAQQFAARLVAQQSDDPGTWVDNAWQIALGRPPSDSERDEALALMESLPKVDDKSASQDQESLPPALAQIDPDEVCGLTGLCLAIFNMNEFLYID